MGSQAHTPRDRALDYAPATHRRRVVSKDLLPLLLLAVPVCVGWGWPHAQRLRDLRVQDECLNHALPADCIVYSDDPADRQRLLAGAGYTDRVPRLGPSVAVIHMPPAWARYAPQRLGGVVFLHRLTSPGGNTRLVAVEVRPAALALAGEPQAGNAVALGAQVIQPATLTADRQPIQLRSHVTVLEGWVNAGDRLRLFAGQPDAADRSHFTIRYTLNDMPGMLDGWLRDDDRVVVTPRENDGGAPPAGNNPASVWQTPAGLTAGLTRPVPPGS